MKVQEGCNVCQGFTMASMSIEKHRYVISIKQGEGRNNHNGYFEMSKRVCPPPLIHKY